MGPRVNMVPSDCSVIKSIDAKASGAKRIVHHLTRRAAKRAVLSILDKNRVNIMIGTIHKSSYEPFIPPGRSSCNAKWKSTHALRYRLLKRAFRSFGSPGTVTSCTWSAAAARSKILSPFEPSFRTFSTSLSVTPGGSVSTFVRIVIWAPGSATFLTVPSGCSSKRRPRKKNQRRNRKRMMKAGRTTSTSHWKSACRAFSAALITAPVKKIMKPVATLSSPSIAGSMSKRVEYSFSSF
mmetsp:Transcript_12011/g.43851  ORF Transcript_12011/g.43851 Transcript_12011/m.43851 type:complete len:238 (-) Transcript_12011:360-1073(-)